MGLFDDISKGLFGGDTGASDWQSVLDQYKNLLVPTISSQEITPEAYTVAGELTPAQELAEQLRETDALQNVSLDPRLKKTQMDSLSMLEKIATGGGMTPEDKASLQLALNKVEADANSRNQAMLQSQDVRGVGSSDMATAARVQGAQSAANRAAEAALTNQVEGRRRALEAMTGASNMASQMENAEYGRGAALANSLNAREAANVNARNAAMARNVGATNAANEFNLQNKQQTSNQNVQSRNLAQSQNKGLIQQQFQNNLSKLAGVSGATGGVAGSKAAETQGTRDMWGNIIAGGAKMYTGGK